MQNAIQKALFRPLKSCNFHLVPDDGQLKEITIKEVTDTEITGTEKTDAETIHSKESDAESSCIDLPLDWENSLEVDDRTSGIHFDSIPDALMHCLSTIGSVDIPYISSITGEDDKTVIQTLKGSIYQNPDTWNECYYKGWETSDEYLSGNLIRKWKSANKANEKYNGLFADNLRAIERVLPSSVPAEEIYVTLGSPWLPADVIDDFIMFLLGNPLESYYSRHFSNNTKPEMPFCWKALHDEINGTWEIPCKSRYNHSVSVRNTYGTDRIEALHIIERTLNMQPVAVTDEIDCPTNASGKKRVINEEETAAALEKQKLILEAFRTWVWADAKRKKRLEKIFEENFSCVKKRIFDGSFLEFPTLSPHIRLYPYQKDAVARILFTPNTLLAHDVGAGKTFVMIVSGQELKRMGLSAKNMYVVPNNIVGQWERIFHELYPDARLLCIEPKNFTPKKRMDMLTQIRDGDYDGIIIAYSCFELIPLSNMYDSPLRI